MISTPSPPLRTIDLPPYKGAGQFIIGNLNPIRNAAHYLQLTSPKCFDEALTTKYNVTVREKVAWRSINDDVYVNIVLVQTLEQL